MISEEKLKVRLYNLYNLLLDYCQHEILRIQMPKTNVEIKMYSKLMTLYYTLPEHTYVGCVRPSYSSIRVSMLYDILKKNKELDKVIESIDDIYLQYL